MVRRLVEAGADASKADNSGNTPMHAAAGEGAVSVVQYLVGKGVSGRRRNVESLTPLVSRAMRSVLRQGSTSTTRWLMVHTTVTPYYILFARKFPVVSRAVGV